MSRVIDFSLVEADAILFEATSLQSYGYGIVSQYVTKNKNISVSAKGVYAYLVSCAGNDKQTYPKQTTMCYDLGIKKVDTLKKYIKELQKEGFIRVVKTKKNGMYYKNVYLIATDTRSIEVWKRQFEKGIEIDEEETLEPAKNKKDNKKAPTLPQVEANEELEQNISSDSTNKNFNNSIPQEDKKENSKNLETNQIDYEKIAVERCKKEIPGFDNMPQIRKDINIGIMLQRIARGE